MSSSRLQQPAAQIAKTARFLSTSSRRGRVTVGGLTSASTSSSLSASSSAPSFRAQSSSATTSSTTTYSNNGSNPALRFPCLDANERRAQRIAEERGLAFSPYASTSSSSEPVQASSSSSKSATSSSTTTSSPTSEAQDNVDESGPEPAYAKVVSGYKTYHHPHQFELDYGGTLPQFDLAYETWGTLSPQKDNVILLHTGLSASSHAHSTPENPAEGWWEKFIGPGKALDTDRFFVICTNVLGGCYGSTGPSSVDPSDGKAYATRFPILSIFDMVRAQYLLLDSMGINKLYASVGSSMGGQQSIAAAHMHPDRVGKVVSISGSARSSPSSIALRYAQRSGG